MLIAELVVLAWFTTLGAAVGVLIGVVRPGSVLVGALVAPLLGLVTSGVLAAALVTVGVSHVVEVLVPVAATLLLAVLVVAWRVRRLVALSLTWAGAVVSGAAVLGGLFVTQGPILTPDSYRFVMLGRAMEGGRLDPTDSVAANYPVLVMHVQALARAVGTEYVVYATTTASALAIVAAFVLTAQVTSDRDRRIPVVAGAALAVSGVATYMTRVQLTYLNSHLAAAALFALAVASAVVLHARPDRSLLAVLACSIAGVTLVRLEGLLLATLLLVFVAEAVDLDRNDLVVLAGGGLAAPSMWYGGMLVGGASGEIVDPVTLGLSLLAPIVMLAFAAIPRRHPLRRLVDGRLAVIVLLGALVVVALAERSHVAVSVGAQLGNTFASGGWGVVWWSFAALGSVRLVESALAPQAVSGAPGAPVVRWVTVTLAVVVLITLLGALREAPYRAGWGDSGNRMLVHVVPTMVLWCMWWAGARGDHRPDRSAADLEVPADRHDSALREEVGSC